MPWPSYDFPTWLAVAFLIDRSAATDGPALEAAKAAAQSAYDALQDDDVAALLAFDARVETMVRPTCTVAQQRKRFTKALASVAPRGASNLAAALDETRDYMAPAKDRKVIVLFTDCRRRAGGLHARSRHSRMRASLLVVALPGANADALRVLPFGRWIRIFELDDASAESALASQIDAMHEYR